MTDRWREVYEREYPRLVRALLAIGRDPAAAEDAAQEAFVKAHRMGRTRSKSCPLGSLWLVRARSSERPSGRAARPICGHRYRPVMTGSTPLPTASISLPHSV